MSDERPEEFFLDVECVRIELSKSPSKFSLRSDAHVSLCRIEAVLTEVKKLRDSGYDGPFIGDATEPLFAALRGLEMVP